MFRRAIALGIFVVAIGLGVFTLDVVRDDPGYGLADASALDAAALLVPGWALVACGLLWWLGRREAAFGALLVLAGFAWFAPEWNNPAIGSSLAFTAGLALFAACPVLVGHASLAYPGGRLTSTAERVAVLFAYSAGIVASGLLPAVLSDPRAQACSVCPANLLAVANRETLADDLSRAAMYLALAWSAGLVVLAARRLGRRTTRPVVTAGTAYLVLVATTFALSLGDSYVPNGTSQHRLWIAQALALVALVTGVAWGWIRVRRARADMARLVVELSRSPPPGGLRDVLAGIVRDPDLVLAYPLDSGRMLDARGLPVALPAGRQQTSLVLDGRIAAVLAHAPGVLDDEHLASEVTTAARLALENERLRAEARSRLEDLRTSRARIVAAGDAERERLERDLHDGAQQRLVALSLSLRLARLKAPDAQELEQAEHELVAAIEELRELAHGIFPAVLADDGLNAAVHALSEETRTLMRIVDLPDRRFDQPLETAAYTVVAETVRAATGRVTVRAGETDGVLRVELETPGANGLDVVALEDRVGALDGRLDVVRGADGTTTVRAELPCAS